MHPLKAELPIPIIDDGIMISLSDEHPSKAGMHMQFTEEGIV